MSGMSDLAQNIFTDNTKAAKSPANLMTGGLYGGVKNTERLDVTRLKKDHSTLTGKEQKTAQLAKAEEEANANMAAAEAKIADDAATAEKKRRAGIMPSADTATETANKRRRTAASAAASGRDSTILTGQRLGD